MFPEPLPWPPSVSMGQLVVDIGADLRRIGVPLWLPVTVDLPVWAGGCGCLAPTTGEPRRAQRRGRYKGRDGSPMRPRQRVLRSVRPRLARQTGRRARPQPRGEWRRPNRWRRGDRPWPAAHALRSRPDHSTPVTKRESSDGRAWRRMTARGMLLSCWSRTAEIVMGLSSY
jgi:hypothetical protein